MFTLLKIRDSIAQRRKNELATELRKLGFNFEKYRDCIVLEIGCIRYWVTPNALSYIITSDDVQRSYTYRHKKSVIGHLNLIKELDKDL